jgi:hypothetical protein
MIAARQIAFGKGGRKDYTAKDYVQDGLVAMWDGIENAGRGVHDDTATVWKDLVGVYGLDLPTRDHVWEDNCIRCDSTLPMYARRTQAFFDVTKDGYTAECVVHTPSANGAFMGIGGEPCLFMYSSSLIFSKWGNYYGGVGTSRAQGSTYIKVGDVGLSGDWYNRKFSFSITGDIVNQITRQYVNTDLSAPWVGVDGVQVDHYPDAAMVGLDSPYFDALGINCSGRYGDKYNDGIGNGTRYFNARIYGRALTADEVKHNYEIDKARFGL